MLEFDGYCGFKTGFTNKAGPCLATLFKKDSICLIIIILNCLSKDVRYLNLILYYKMGWYIKIIKLGFKET